MIDAVQRFLAKHRRWLFACLLVVVVVPFVFTIGATPGCVGGRKQRDKMFFGVDISSAMEVEDLQRATAFSLHFSGCSESIPLDSAMMARAAWLWIASALQIPDPGEVELRDFIRSRPAFLDEDGNFSEERYDDFFQALRDQAPELEQFMARTLADDWRIGTVAGTLAAANFSLPSEALLRAQQLNTEWKLSGATLRFADFHPAIDVSESDLETFFAAHRDLFRTPVQVVFDYAKFSKPIGEVCAEDGEQILAYLRANGLCNNDDDPTIPKDGETKSEAIVAAAEQVAMARASEFIYRIYGFEENPQWNELCAAGEEFAATIHGPCSASSNGAYDGDPAPESVRRAALQLAGENRLSQPLSDGDGIYVAILRRRVESRERPFWEVRTAVEQGYRRQKQVDLFLDNAMRTREKLLAKLAGGESFSDAARALGMDVQKSISFTIKKLPQEIPQEWIGSFLGLNCGGLTDFMLISRPDLQLWFVDGKKIPAPSELVDDMKAFENEYANGSGPAFVRQVLEELIVDEMKKVK